MGAIDVSDRDCQVEVGQWPLHGTLFDLFAVVERESFLPRGWTLISTMDFGEEKGITFAHVKREIGGDRMLCDKTVTVNPIKEDAGDNDMENDCQITQESSEILLQVVAKVFPPTGRGSASTNFTVTQIHALSDIVTILTDAATYSDGIQVQGEKPEEDYNHYHLGGPRSADSPPKHHIGGHISITSHDFFHPNENNYFTEVDSITLDGDGDTDSSDHDVYPLTKKRKGESSLAKSSIGGGVVDDGDGGSGADAIEWIDSPPTSSTSFSGYTSQVAQRAPRTDSKMFPKSDDPDRPFQCPSCPSKFKRANHFKDHLRTHKDESFQCPVCPFTCKLQTLFTNHMTNKHNGKGPFPCPECPQEFERVHDLARHLPRDHRIDTGFKLSHFEKSSNDSPYRNKPGRPRGSFGVTNGVNAEGPSTSSTPTSSSRSRNLEDDFDFGKGSMEDMQRLMRLYDAENDDSPSMVPRSAPTDLQLVPFSTPSPARRGRPIGSVNGSGRGRGRPPKYGQGVNGSPGEVDDDCPPDPSDAWVRQYFMGCKQCGIDDLGTEQQFSQHFLNVHNDDRPYKCQDLKKEGCTSAFRMRTTYKEHIRGVHNSDIKHFKCKSCPKRFATRSGLTQHTLQHSQFRCGVCRMKFLTVRAMARHKAEQNHHGDGPKVSPIKHSASSSFSSSSLSDSVRDSVIAAAVAIANGTANPKLGGSSSSSSIASPFANLAASNAAASALRSANGSRSNSPLAGGNGKRSLNEVALALAEDAGQPIGVKSLEDEMQFDETDDMSIGNSSSSVFPDMQQHIQRHESVFPGTM